MATYEVLLTLQGPAGKVVIPPDDPSFEAESMKDALKILSNSDFPDNRLVRTIGVSLRRTSDLEVAQGPGFKDVSDV